MKLRHLAIIMDGNGRWAKAHGHHRIYGHAKGARVAKQIIEHSAKLKIPYLTLFTFSTENWSRPVEEVSFLMHLLARRLRKERQSLCKNDIRFQCIGDIQSLPNRARAEVEKTIEETKNNRGMVLTLALSYGGRQEILEASKQIAQDISQGHLKAEDLSEEVFSSYLPSSPLPDPDLILRTSGETRISNFFLWQSAYAELIFSDKLWPDFHTKDLDECILSFQNKERRFGKTSAQLDEPEALELTSPNKHLRTL